MKLGFKCTINWNEYQSKVTTQAGKQYLDYFIDGTFQGANRLFVLSFEDNAHWKRLQSIFSSNCRKITMLWSMEKTISIKSLKNDLRTNDNIRKITTGQGDCYINSFLLN